MAVKQIVCLAKSRRKSGLCIAGKELMDGQVRGWIRPVDKEDDAVSVEWGKYRSGDELKLLDVVEIDLLEPAPDQHQRENWRLRREQKWMRVCRLNREALPGMCDNDEQLWENGHCTNRGINDYVPYQTARRLTDSLRLIRVDRLTLSVIDYNPRVRVRGKFRYRGIEYALWVTDVEYENQYKSNPLGDYLVGERYLAISLAGKFVRPGPNNPECYKLIAGIM